MKRLFLLVAVLVPLSLFLAGCNGSAGSSGKSSEPTADQKKEMLEQMEKSKAQMAKENEQARMRAPAQGPKK